MYRIGIDIGGTFTDFTVVDEVGEQRLWKEDTTPREPDVAIFRGLEAVAGQLGLTVEQLLRQTQLLVHGSTIATNTVIERDAEPIGLVCTEGFRDIVYFRDGFKPERFNLRLRRPRDFVARELRIGVKERVGPRGEVIVPLDEESVSRAARQLADANVAAVAVAFLWSVIRPDHERRAAEIIEQRLGVPVICSSDVLPEIREWERTSATVLSAYVAPRLGEYLRRLERRLADAGLPGRPLIMQITGGCATVDEILRRPVSMLASGPAAAPAAAAHVAGRVGSRNVITIDMGGTSLDVSMLRDAEPVMSRDVQVEGQPIGVSAVEVHSIGAGGGSIAWVDDGGVLRVGPESAKAAPGPAAYGEGGDRPTVTDANVVLGYLDPATFLGGRRTLRADLARRAVERHVAEPLGLSATEAAAGILEVVDTNMVAGIRAISVERGVDPREFILVSAGGAGGLHASRLADALGIERVLIAREASTFCSFGMTVADVRHDDTTPWYQVSDAVDLERLNALYRDLEARARDRLRADGFPDELIALQRAVDARYPNQVHEITVPLPTADAYAADDLAAFERAFHAEHRKQFSYAIEDLPVEILHWRLTASGRISRLASPPPVAEPAAGRTPRDASPIATADAYSHVSGAMVQHAVYDADGLAAGTSIPGPAIIRSPITTVLVNEGDELVVHADGALLIDVGVGRRDASGQRLTRSFAS